MHCVSPSLQIDAPAFLVESSLQRLTLAVSAEIAAAAMLQAPLLA
jgi:hypothetical protein